MRRGNGAERARPVVAAHDLAWGGVFGAAALLLPVVFHVLQLGAVFMPMYLPLVALAFLVRPGVAASAALLVPLLSAVVTGMPPLYPPVAAIMALELAFMGFCIAVASRRWPAARPWLVLLPVLLVGRALNLALTWWAARLLGLPAGLVAGAWLLSGWPGLILILVVVPPLVRVVRGAGGPRVLA
jgi:hypothetical protein